MKPTQHIAATALASLLFATPSIADEHTMQDQSPSAESWRSNPAGPQDSGTARLSEQENSQRGVISTPVEQIEGTRLCNRTGDRLGEVKGIVRQKTSGELFAVISLDESTGADHRIVAIPADYLRWRNDELLGQLASDEQLTAYPAYDHTKFEAVPTEQYVRLRLAIRPDSGVASSNFQELDTNGDGYLSKEEARDRALLTDQWQRVDSNRDDRIDQVEFAAFEPYGDSNPAVRERPDNSRGTEPQRESAAPDVDNGLR